MYNSENRARTDLISKKPRQNNGPGNASLETRRWSILHPLCINPCPSGFEASDLQGRQLLLVGSWAQEEHTSPLGVEEKSWWGEIWLAEVTSEANLGISEGELSLGALVIQAPDPCQGANLLSSAHKGLSCARFHKHQLLLWDKMVQRIGLISGTWNEAAALEAVLAQRKEEWGLAGGGGTKSCPMYLVGPSTSPFSSPKLGFWILKMVFLCCWSNIQVKEAPSAANHTLQWACIFCQGGVAGWNMSNLPWSHLHPLHLIHFTAVWWGQKRSRGAALRVPD